MQRKPVQHEELEPEYLDIVAGGRSQVLKREFHPSTKTTEASHYYETLSDPIPGATLAQANALLNRYNAPTHDGLKGEGNDPHATGGVVAEPYTPWGLPIGGSITMTRGVGDDDHAWVKNTTDALHPFIGSITRTVVDSPEGYRILTVGEGHGDGAIPIFPNNRHEANAKMGPEIFQDLDDNMLNHWHKPEPAHDAQPHAAPAQPHVEPAHPPVEPQPHADPARADPQSGFPANP
jgi:hypothetical protein